MATYDAKRTSFARTPVWYVKLTMDFCANTFGNAPCTAIGTGDKKCLNTFFTCKDTANYVRTTKVYRFCSNGELPFSDGERPYIESVTSLPTEIKESLPVLGRISVTMYDEPDGDVGIDPYVGDRTSTQGTFWRKFLERNPNYKGRIIQVYEGFIGIPESEFQLRFQGKIDNITLDRNGRVTISGVDFIGDMKRAKIPYEYDIKVSAITGSTVTTIPLKGDDVDVLSATTGSTYYIRVANELIGFQSSNYDSTANAISNAERGAGNTTPANLAEDVSVSIAPYYSGNVFDMMHELLVNDTTRIDRPGMQLSTVYVNTTKFEAERDFSVGSTEVLVSGWVDETMSVEDAYFDMARLMDVKTWVGEDLKITVDRRIQNRPNRTYKKITDDANIVLGSDMLDQNEKSRYTREFLLWSYNPVTDFDKGQNFLRRDFFIDLDLESSNAYAEPITDITKTRFFRQGVMSEQGQDRFVINRNRRWLQNRRVAKSLIDIELEYKDSEIKTGDFVRIGSDVFTDVLGNPVSSATCQVIRRDVNNNRVSLKLERQPDSKVGFVGPSSGAGGSSAYTVATESQANYAFIAAADSASSTGAVLDNSDPAYLIY